MNKINLLLTRIKNKVKEFLNDKTFFYFLLENFHIMQLVKSLYVNLSNEAYIDYVVKEDPNLKKIRKKLTQLQTIKRMKREIS